MADKIYNNKFNIFHLGKIKSTRYCGLFFISPSTNIYHVITIDTVFTFLDFAHFLKMWKRLCIETYPHFLNLPTFGKCGNVSI